MTPKIALASRILFIFFVALVSWYFVPPRVLCALSGSLCGSILVFSLIFLNELHDFNQWQVPNSFYRERINANFALLRKRTKTLLAISFGLTLLSPLLASETISGTPNNESLPFFIAPAFAISLYTVLYIAFNYRSVRTLKREIFERVSEEIMGKK